MRAKEFTINIPINIKFGNDGEPELAIDQTEPVDDDTGTFVPPLQQKIELLKKSTGVKSVFDLEAQEDEPLE